MQPGEEIIHGRRHIRRDAEHGFDARWPKQRIGDDIDVPDADFSGLGRQTQLVLAVMQPGIRCLKLRGALGDAALELGVELFKLARLTE